MSPERPETLLHRHLTPIVAVIDANVFARSAWIKPIVQAVQDGILTVVWSPLIISEVNRLLTWLWIRRHASDTSEAARRRCSADFKVWYANVAVNFHVVEDRPPLAEMWTDSPTDPWDAPIWTAAVRAREAFGVQHVLVITDNLRDSPPLNQRGLRTFAGVTFLHPEDLQGVISRWLNLRLTGNQPPDEELPPSAARRMQDSEEASAPRADILQLVTELLEVEESAPSEDAPDTG
ncbi:MAG: PIN domain-containing protein [Chloroflexota bacterium]